MKAILHLPRILIGAGLLRSLPDELAALGVRKPLIVTDRNLVALGALARVIDALGQGGAFAVFDGTPENPTSAGVDAAHDVYVAQSCDSVVALGGGSVLDTGKLVGVLATHGGNADDYLGQSAKVGPRTAPVIAVPTTAGTGSEASSVASIHPVAAARALSVAGPSVAPKVAICDPELTYSLPPGLTAATGMDALSHCIESALAAPEHAIYAALALDGIARVRRFLPAAVRNGADAQARLEMMTAALTGGVVLSRGLGPAHAIAIACGEQGVNHGVLSTIGMIATLDLTGLKAPDRMVPVAAALGIGPGASVARCVEEMARDLRVPTRLAEAGYKMGDIDALARMCAESRFNSTSVHHPSAAEYRIMLERVA